MTDQQDQALPLAGVRVLEVGGELSAYCTKLLADFGADVLRVEEPDGDRQRARPPFLPGQAEAPLSLVFEYYNANKRAATIRMDDPGAHDLLCGLAMECDVVVLAPGHTQRVPGWDHGSARPNWAPANALVCVLTPWGIGGPHPGSRSTHLVSFAASGLMWSIGPAEGPPLALPCQAAFDELGAHAAAMIMTALREGIPDGRCIDLALHDLLAYRATNPIAIYARTGREFASRSTIADPPPAGVWQLEDGVIELAVYQPAQWDAFLEMIGKPAALADPSFRNRGTRLDRADEVVATVGPLLRSWSVEDFLVRAGATRVPCAPLRDPADLVTDIQLQSREFWTTRKLADGRLVTTPGLGFRSSPPIARIGGVPAPRLGSGEAGWNGTRPTFSGTSLKQLRVISFGTAIAGNVSAMMLAELGADVIKIESPVLPDPLRNGPITSDLGRVFEPSGAETNIRFAGYARSCRSVALDMKDPADRDRLRWLAARADVVIDNFASGVMDKWGMGHDVLAAVNPRLILASVSGYGRTGPRAHLRAYGSNINAYLGLTRSWFSHSTQCDWTAVAHLLAAVAAALIRRDRTGTGCLIDVAQTEAAAAMFAPLYLAALNGVPDVDRTVEGLTGSLMAATLPAAGDDQWVAVEIEDARDRDLAFSVVGAGDAQPRVDVRGRDEHDADRLNWLLRDWVSKRTAEQAARELRNAGLPAARVANTAELFDDAQLWARKGFMTAIHPDLGPLVFPAPFQRINGVAPEIRWPAPRLGVHTDEVFARWA